MSLVDYASSSSDEEVDDVVPEDIPQQQTQKPEIEQPKPPQPQLPPRRSSLEPLEKLPDASLLLNSVPSSSSGTATDHASRVAAAMASRKRDPVSDVGPTLPRSKIPRGTLPHSKNFPDTVGGLLVPPQLSGRRNIVTEDIGKLFVSRHRESSSS